MKNFLAVVEVICWLVVIMLGAWMFVEIMKVNTSASMLTMWYGILTAMAGGAICHGIRRG